MRLLPRSPRGTWLLAGAVWLAGCGALWWVLPYRPRAMWPTEVPASVHGFIPGTAVVLTCPLYSLPDPSVGLPGPLLARDTATGEVREWLSGKEQLVFVDPGVDGRHVLIGRIVEGRTRLSIHDASDGSILAEVLRGGPPPENAKDRWPDPLLTKDAFRPDGRRIFYQDLRGDPGELRVWDVETKREVAAISDAGLPAAWSPDGESIVYTTYNRDANALAVRLWDLKTGQTRPLGTLPSDEAKFPTENRSPVEVRFSPDGQSVVFHLATTSRSEPEDEDALVGWDVASGRQNFRRRARSATFPANVTWFLSAESSGNPEIRCVGRRDYATGTTRDQFALKTSPEGGWLGLSPDGKLILGYDLVASRLWAMLNWQVLRGALGDLSSDHAVIWETGSGRRRYVLPTTVDAGLRSSFWYGRSERCGWSRDGALLAIAGEEELTVWDIAPRKPLWWFAAGALLFAVPLFVIVRWRVRRLRREAAA